MSAEDLDILRIDVSIPVVPVSRSNRRYAEFRIALKQAIKPHSGVTFTGEVRLSWTLHIDELERRETDRIADLDNFAKGMNDAIKGSDGVIVDDSQIQSLNVAWIDTPGHPFIDLRVESTLTPAISKPLMFCEMPDGLYYPIGLKWNSTYLEAVQLYSLASVLQHRNMMASRLTEHGESKELVAWALKYTRTYADGFHRSRVVDSGYKTMRMLQWRQQYALPSELADAKIGVDLTNPSVNRG